MIVNNVFKAIGDFCANVLFAPFEEVRFSDNWWLQNTASWIFIIIAFVGFIYWLNQLKIHRNSINE
ncbi:MAG: uracil phosphoribosyltransferase [Lutibacter sp.]|nr:uracil phosphoribosyltransferase [Lutibacter sp.]